jgi:hypothetical protein
VKRDLDSSKTMKNLKGPLGAAGSVVCQGYFVTCNRGVLLRCRPPVGSLATYQADKRVQETIHGRRRI